jgi:predicted enzyme related to lactoylglutathione lyase
VDVSSADVPTTADFYCQVFGWELGPDMGADAGGYRLFTKGGLNVAGIGPLMEGVPSWTTYLKVDDLDGVAARVPELGGVLAVPPMDLPNDSGRMAFAIDVDGGFVGLFQPGPNHSGAQLVNEVGTVVWNELATRKPDEESAFYSALLGWTVQPMPEMDYRTLLIDGRAVGGMMPMGPEFPAEVPTHWLTYFAVDDAAATAAQVTELGGTVINGPFDSPVGPLAVLADPTGAMFAVGAFTQIDDPNDWPQATA